MTCKVINETEYIWGYVHHLGITNSKPNTKQYIGTFAICIRYVYLYMIVSVFLHHHNNVMLYHLRNAEKRMQSSNINSCDERYLMWQSLLWHFPFSSLFLWCEHLLEKDSSYKTNFVDGWFWNGQKAVCNFMMFTLEWFRCTYISWNTFKWELS